MQLNKDDKFVLRFVVWATASLLKIKTTFPLLYEHISDKDNDQKSDNLGKKIRGIVTKLLIESHMLHFLPSLIFTGLVDFYPYPQILD